MEERPRSLALVKVELQWTNEVSIKLSPENAWVYHNRGQVYERIGNRENASADYQTSLTKKNPALSPNRKAHAQARLRKLSNRS